MSFFAIGAFELVLSVMAAGGGLFGLPPGERDPALLHCPPPDVAFYTEWASRGSGKPGAPGIDGLAADPEIKEFLANLERSILTAVEKKTAEARPEQKILAQALPGLLKRLLNRSGCLYINYDQQAAQKAAEEGKPLGRLGALWGLQAAVVIGGGDAADAIAGDIEKLLELLPAASRTEDLQRQPLPLPLPGLKLTLHRHKKHFIVGFGPNTIDGAVAGLSGESKGLTDNKRFGRAMERIAIERTAGVSWIDVKGIVDKIAGAGLGLQEGAVKGMVKLIGADAIDSIASVTGVVDGQLHSKSLMTTGGRTDGILSLFAGRGIKPADLRHVPADADFVTAVSIGAPQILAAARDIVGKADPNSREVFDQVLERFEEEFGASIETDLFQAFGDVWVFHDSPAAGGLFITSLTGGLEIRDAGKAKTVFDQAMKVLDQVLPGETRPEPRPRGVFLEKSEFLDHTVYFINTVGDDDVPFAPAFCLTDTHLVVAPHPQAMKAQLRFLQQADAADFRSRLEKLLPAAEGDRIAVTYFDTKSLVRYVYALAPYVGQVALSNLQREGIPLNVFSLPSARAVLPYVGDSVSTVVRTKEGILTDAQTALPLPGGAGLLMNLPIMLLQRRMRMGIGDNHAPDDTERFPRRAQPRIGHRPKGGRRGYSAGIHPRLNEPTDAKLWHSAPRFQNLAP